MASSFTPVRIPLASTTLRSDDPLILIGDLCGHPGEERGAIRGHRHPLRAVDLRPSPILRGIAEVYFSGMQTS
jgi:hypothetical protein